MAPADGRRKTMRTSIMVVLFLAAAGVAGYLGMRTLADTGLRLPIAPSRPAAPTPARQDAPDVQSVKIFVVRMEGNEATLEPITVWVPRAADPKVAAINRLLGVGRQRVESADLIPEGTKLLSLKVRSGLATVDLSSHFVDNFSGGSLQESLTLAAIVRTLTQFSDVNRVQILVEGRTVESLGGHFGIAEPLSYHSGQLATGVTE